MVKIFECKASRKRHLNDNPSNPIKSTEDDNFLFLIKLWDVTGISGVIEHRRKSFFFKLKTVIDL